MQAAQAVGVEVTLHDVDVLAADHPVDADRREEFHESVEHRPRIALLVLAEDADGLGEQAVACEDRDVLAVDDVRGRAPRRSSSSSMAGRSS